MDYAEPISVDDEGGIIAPKRIVIIAAPDAEGLDGAPDVGGYADVAASDMAGPGEADENYPGEADETADDEANEGNDGSMLNGRQMQMQVALSRIADAFGKFTGDTSADGAHYMEKSPFTQGGIVCSNCVFYEGGGGCEVVDGEIASNGVCKLWIIPEKLVTTDNGAPISPSMSAGIQSKKPEDDNAHVGIAMKSALQREIARYYHGTL